MSIAERLAVSGTCVFYWVEIDGLYGSWWAHTPPTNWSVTSPKVTLDPPSEWAGVEARIDPLKGIAPSGRLEVRISLPGSADDETDDPWLEYIANDVTQGNVCVLTADLDPSDTTATVDDTSSFASAGVLYLGRETVAYTGKTSTTFTGLVRGHYGSTATFHPGSPDTAVEFGVGGAYVSDRPLSLSDRRVRVYRSCGILTRDGIIAYGTGPTDTDEVQTVYAGYVRDVSFDRSLRWVTLSTESVRSALAGKIATKLPTRTCGGNPAWIYIGPHNNTIGWAWWMNGVPSGSDYDRIYTAQLQRSDGGGGTENVPDGWYPSNAVAGWIGWTIGGGTATNGITVDSSGNTVVAPAADAIAIALGALINEERGGTHSVLTVSLTPTAGFTLQLLACQILREWGWPADAITGPLSAGGRDDYTITSPELRAALYVPGNHQALEVWAEGDTIVTSPFEDADGNAIAAYGRIADEVVRISAGSKTGTVALDARGQIGSRVGEIYVPDTTPFEAPDLPTLVQGVVLPGVPWGLAALQLAYGYGDTGWRGSGLDVDAGAIDAASFLSYGDDVRTIAYWEPTALDEVLRHEAVLSGTAIIERDGQIALRSTAPPLLSSTSVVTLDDTVLAAGSGVGLSLAESRIVNEIVGEGIGYDPGADFAAERVTVRDLTSVGTYGAQQAVTVNLRHVTGAYVARAQLVSLAQRVWAGWSRPVYVLELDVAMPDVGWLLQLLDEVSITHALVPDRATAQRGVTELRGRVYGVRPVLRGGGAAARIQVIAHSTAQRWSGYAPQARCNNIASTTLTVDDYWAGEEGGPVDAARFEVGWEVQVYEPGGTANTTRTITGITLGATDASEIELDGTVTATAPAIVEFAAWTSVVSAQQVWAFIGPNTSAAPNFHYS